MRSMPELKKTSNTDLNLQAEVMEFKNETEQLSVLLRQNNVWNALAYRTSSLPTFLKLDKLRQRQSINEIQFYRNSLQMAALDERTVNEKQSLWSSLKLMGLRPMSDILDIVNSEDSVEAYDIAGIQFWRNFRFFEVCSYTLEEMFSLPWQERYDRDEEAVKKTEDVVRRIMIGEITETYNCDIRNILVERLSENKFVIDVRHTHISPLFDQNNRVAGFIVVSKVKLLGADNTNNLPTSCIDFM